MIDLRKGIEPNSLELVIGDSELKPDAILISGVISDGIRIKIHNYNLDNLLVQLLDEYSEEELIKRIKLL